MEKNNGKGLAIAGFVLSIVGIVFGILSGWLSLVALPIAIIGLVLAVNGRKKLIQAQQPAGLGTAGLVLGIIAVVFSAIAFFTCGICVICAAGAAESLDGAYGNLQNIFE